MNRRSAVQSIAASIVGFSASARPVRSATGGDRAVSVRSACGFDETIERLKADIALKKIMLFDVIDQAKLASRAGIKFLPSTLIVFGNPPLGVQFRTSNPAAGLDWPVRLLVTEDARGQVLAMYTDFAWIAQRHGIENRAQFKMASDVIPRSPPASRHSDTASQHDIPLPEARTVAKRCRSNNLTAGKPAPGSE